MVAKVVELRLRFIALMAGTGLIFGYWDTIWNRYEKWSRPPAELATAAAEVEYYCPMHPSVVLHEPGSCPICGMPLSKRKFGEQESLPAGVLSRLELSESRIFQAGIATSEVAYSALSETITTVGSVTFDERRQARISSKTKGLARVEKLHVNFTGDSVKAGEPLAELYSPELHQAFRELLLAHRSAKERPPAQTALGRSLAGNDTELLSLAREKLIRWGITPKQIDEAIAKGKAEVNVAILSPLSGIVTRKNVVEGQYLTEGETLFEVADLSHVWVTAQVYENQFSSLRIGQPVEAEIEAYPGETFPGTVAFIAPTLNPETRVVDVRYDLENADSRLRPGMFATVRLKMSVANSPAFRAQHPGRSVPDAMVASLSVEDQKVCPVTMLKLGSMGKPIEADLDGKKVWICCASCTSRLKAEPAKYLARLNPAPIDQVLSVPESAVIDTGARKLVYVEAGPGVFEGREVVLGPISDGRYPVLEGLSLGEKVATTGSFLIDAENRLNPRKPTKPEEPPAKTRKEPVRSASAPISVHRH
jgi:Cu(I)/Ag(I) efflux system membrane fusion protein